MWLALLSGGCVWTGVQERDEEYEFQEPFDRLEFTSWGGNVSLTFTDTDRFQANLHYRYERVEPHVTWVLEDGVLAGEVNCEVLDGRCAVDVVVVSPFTSTMVVYVHRGDLEVIDAGGDATLEVRFGDLTLDGLEGDLDTTVHRGDLSALGLGGAQSLLETLDGSAFVEQDTGFDLMRVYVEGGDLDLTVPAGTYHLLLGQTVGGLAVDPDVDSDATSASSIQIQNLTGMSWIRAGADE